MHLVAELRWEKGTQWPICQTCSQSSLLAGPSFPPEESPRDLASSIEPLFIVYGQGEEIGRLPRLRAGASSNQNHSIPITDRDCSVGLPSQLVVFYCKNPLPHHTLKDMRHYSTNLQTQPPTFRDPA